MHTQTVVQVYYMNLYRLRRSCSHLPQKPLQGNQAATTSGVAYVSMYLCLVSVFRNCHQFSLMIGEALSGCAVNLHSCGSSCTAGYWPLRRLSAGAPVWPTAACAALLPQHWIGLGEVQGLLGGLAPGLAGWRGWTEGGSWGSRWMQGRGWVV